MPNFTLPEHELMSSGHLACQGCGGAHAMRYALKALGPKTVIVMPACCWSVIDGPFPHTAVTVPVLHTAFETAGATASGVRAGLDARGDRETVVMAWAGDGGTFDIGLQALSGAAERNEDIIYACYDNEAYMNTGIQRSSATPPGAWTTTTPAGHTEDRPKKRILDIMLAHEIPYAATATVAWPDDLLAKFERARSIRGMRFIHVYAPCPTGWKSPPDRTIEISRLAVETRLFPLVEVVDGRVHVRRDVPRKPVREFYRSQSRFDSMSDAEIEAMQESVDRRWAELVARAEAAVDAADEAAG